MTKILQENDVPFLHCAAARNSFPLYRKPSESPRLVQRGQAEPFLAVQAPAEQRLHYFRLCLPNSRTRGHWSRISCVIPVRSQDEAVREAFQRILLVTLSLPRRSVLRVYWKFHALQWLFLRFGFLETWERSRPHGPEYYDCELASESNCTLGNDIFNSRYFSSAILTKVYDKTRVNWRIKAEFRLFLVIFVPILKFSLWAGHCGCVLNFF